MKEENTDDFSKTFNEKKNRLKESTGIIIEGIKCLKSCQRDITADVYSNNEWAWNSYWSNKIMPDISFLNASYCIQIIHPNRVQIQRNMVTLMEIFTILHQ